MIIKAFLRWTETANASDRAKAAGALARAYLKTIGCATDQRKHAVHAMMHLLDDPSAKVRQALAQALAPSVHAPRSVIMGLAGDQPDVACHVLMFSPVVTDSDLVDLCGRGNAMTRGLIAARPGLSRMAAAAIAEVGDLGEILILLENEAADISRYSLKRLAERFGAEASVRNQLLVRTELPPEARHLLIGHVSSLLAASPLVQSTLSPTRIAHVTREASDLAALSLAGTAASRDLPKLVEQLAADGRLTAAFLMHALCSGKIEFFAAAIAYLTGLDERRVRGLMATSRRHAVRALYESAGLNRPIAEVFAEATLLWREISHRSGVAESDSICLSLILRFKDRQDDSSVAELLDLVESLQHSEERQLARSFADRAAA
ncbi:DUF2336 domain-containing protein [Rhizobium sp. SSA_523]|uniref:DUF2336 domain-containing protein n=1 Tax=Rhizobium sp. SSA_523 TaxID=2952477 RepID=UPI002090D02C|nr:DUF2336 domain-containing protein [Rhizobium sp. SSA_523]MCO5733822.1 DUF2336 domain-containing protein [Rhizobium sp. SSA_523]WKC24906.1 DUF2336 domain-containing protein [Rhizobium sp. SSA_523]